MIKMSSLKHFNIGKHWRQWLMQNSTPSLLVQTILQWYDYDIVLANEFQGSSF